MAKIEYIAFRYAILNKFFPGHKMFLTCIRRRQYGNYVKDVASLITTSSGNDCFPNGPHILQKEGSTQLNSHD